MKVLIIAPKTVSIMPMRALIALALLCIVPFDVRAQAAARLVPFQGRLTDAQGNPVPDGVRLIQFQVYGDPVGGNALWAGEVHRTTVNGGLVNVMLGSKNPLPNDRPDNPSRSFFDGTLYLQITVDTSGPSGVPDGQITAADPPLLPRQAILPVIFASESALSRNSQKLNGYDWSALLLAGANSNNPVAGQIDGSKLGAGSVPGNRLANASITAGQIAPGAVTGLAIAPGGIQSGNLTNAIIQTVHLSPELIQDAIHPPGTVIAWMGTASNPPPGWEFCWGQTVSRTDPKYARVFATIGTSSGIGDGKSTFFLPDLRGMFLRGVNQNRTDSYGDPEALNRTNLVNGGAFGNAVGSVQADAFQGHWHVVEHSLDSGFYYGGAFFTTLGDGSLNASRVRDPISDGVHGTPRTSSETRPQNVYVNYIIKL